MCVSEGILVQEWSVPLSFLVLYKSHCLSIVPESFSEGMFSWFPIYFPIREPVFLPRGSKLDLHFWRRVDSHKVWSVFVVVVVIYVAVDALFVVVLLAIVVFVVIIVNVFFIVVVIVAV